MTPVALMTARSDGASVCSSRALACISISRETPSVSRKVFRSIRETSPERLRLLAKGGDYGLASVAGFERAYCVTLAKLLDGGNNTESGHL